MKQGGETELKREVMKINIGRNREYIKELRNPTNEIEEELNKKVMSDMKQYWRKKQQKQKKEKVKIIKKLPLIDDMKFENMNNKSVAENKRRWKGKRGIFNVRELAKWFKIYDETQLLNAKNTL